MGPTSDLKIVFSSITAEQTYALRHSVLWPDKDLKDVVVTGDETALHIGAYDGALLVGVGSFFQDGTSARLRKLAVLPTHRKRGIGAGVIRQGVALMAEKGLQDLWCDARQDAFQFYTALGFKIEARVFLKKGIPYSKALLHTGIVKV